MHREEADKNLGVKKNNKYSKRQFLRSLRGGGQTAPLRVKQESNPKKVNLEKKLQQYRKAAQKKNDTATKEV